MAFVNEITKPPNVFISNEDFKNSWAKLVMKIMGQGMEVETEYGNQAKDVFSTVVLTVYPIR